MKQLFSYIIVNTIHYKCTVHYKRNLYKYTIILNTLYKYKIQLFS